MKEGDKNFEYIEKTNPSYVLYFYDESSNICPNWFKGIKKNNSSSEFCWRPSKPIIEIKSAWKYGVTSTFILMPEKLRRIDFGDKDFYSQPKLTEACSNSDKITANQRRNELNFTNQDDALCALQIQDNGLRETSLCKLPIEKKYNQYKYLYGGYVGTQIFVNVIRADSKYYTKDNIDNSDLVYIGNGLIKKTTVFGKTKNNTGTIISEGFNKKIKVKCVLNKDREVKSIETIED